MNFDFDKAMYASFYEKVGSVHAVPPEQSEGMSKSTWKQTLLDLPVVVAGTALGYGVGRVAAEELGARAAKQTASGMPPAWLKHVPMGAAAASTALGYALSRSTAKMRERRAEAHKTGKIVR